MWLGLALVMGFLLGLFRSRWLLYIAQSAFVALVVASLKTPKNFQFLSFLLAIILFVALDFLWLRRKITF
mgnify:CR=1 FL=1